MTQRQMKIWMKIKTRDRNLEYKLSDRQTETKSTCICEHGRMVFLFASDNLEVCVITPISFENGIGNTQVWCLSYTVAG